MQQTFESSLRQNFPSGASMRTGPLAVNDGHFVALDLRRTVQTARWPISLCRGPRLSIPRCLELFLLGQLNWMVRGEASVVAYCRDCWGNN